MRLEIKKAVGYQEICVFADLVNSCRIYEEDGLLSARQLRKLMQEEAHMFLLMESLSVETQAIIEEL